MRQNPGMMVHDFNPSIWEAEAGKCLRTSWSTWRVPGYLELHSETVSKQRENKESTKFNFLLVEIKAYIFTSKISSLETSIRQWPAWGCCWESSCRKIFSFWTKSRLYLGTVRHSVSSGHNDTTCCCCWSFNWFWRLEISRSIIKMLDNIKDCNSRCKS